MKPKVQSELLLADAAFVAGVRAILDGQDPAKLGPWQQCLLEQGWLAPHWPEAAGGLNWSPFWLYLWQRELLGAGFGLPPNFESQALGRVLLPELAASEALREAMCATSQEGARWALGMTQPPLGVESMFAGMGDAAADFSAGPTGGVAIMAAVAQPDFMLLPVACDEPATRWQWLCLPATSNLVHHQASGAYLGSLVVDGKLASGAELIGTPQGAAAIHERQDFLLDMLQGDIGLSQALASGDPEHSLAPSQGLARRIARLRDDAPEIDPSELSAVEIDLAALVVLEARAAAADSRRLMDVMLYRSTHLAFNIAQLEVAALGYYALPALDPRLLDNEGSIEPPELSRLRGSQGDAITRLGQAAAKAVRKHE